MEALRTWLWRATVALGVVLLVTGVWLSFFYRPSAPGVHDGVQLMRTVHRACSLPFPAAALALGLLHAVNRPRLWPVAMLATLLAAALSVTGYLLPWDQLALYAVTIGTNMRGLVTAAFDDRVKFVLIGSVEIGQETLRRWFIVHAAVLPIALAGCLAVLRRRTPEDGGS